MINPKDKGIQHPLINREEIRKAYDILTTPGQIVEVRALEASRENNGRYTETLGGYFDNIADLIQSVSTIKVATGIYITLQPCEPQILHRAKNKLIKQKKDFSTPDKYITSYQMLPIDSDPERVSNISSDEIEHQKALGHSRKIRKALKEMGWPDPIEADSGNGGHLLYRINLPTSDAKLIERVLKGLAARFDEEGIHVDQTLYNPSRIIKLYGTMACKGDNTDERPHRLSHIISNPQSIELVSRELLEAIAIPEKEEAPRQNKQQAGWTQESFSLETFLQKYNIQYKTRDNYDGGTRYHLRSCVWDASHTDNSACVYEKSDGRLGASCSHNGCQGRGWRDFRLVFEPDAYTIKEVKPKTETPQKDKEQPSTEKAENTKEETAYSRLMSIAEQARLIRTPDNTLYARVPVNSHHEIVSINEHGSGFRRWLVHQFKKKYGFVPNSDALSQSMAGVMADAEYDGEKAQVHTRIAEKDGCVYLDLANDKWECVEISASGWHVITCPPVYFRRPSGMKPLPLPKTGGSIHELRDLINAKDDKDYILITAWLVGALHPRGPYSVLNLNGERGATKSKTTATLRNLIDPSVAPTRNTPKDEREAAISSQNNMVIALDNLSSIPLWLSDLLCRTATGSGFSTRELYTDDDERVFSARRPIIMNGIEDGIITQGDLLNRTMLVTLTPPTIYRSEEEIDALFDEKHPRILGALLSIVSTALKDRNNVYIQNPPRMADFAKWITAAEPALGWTVGTFMQVYTENQVSSTSIVMETSPVAQALVRLMANHLDGWEGLMNELHKELSRDEIYRDAKTAPKLASRLGGHIRRIASSLRTQGIDVQEPTRTKKGSMIKLYHISDQYNQQLGVGRVYVGVGKPPSGVGKNDLPTPIICPGERPTQTFFDVEGVGGVGNSPQISAPLSSDLVEKNNIKERGLEIPDNLGILPTPPTPPTPDQENIAEDYSENLPETLPGEVVELYDRYESIMPIPGKEVFWHVPGSGYANGYISSADHIGRIRGLLLSGNQQMITAAVEVMKSKLVLS